MARPRDLNQARLFKEPYVLEQLFDIGYNDVAATFDVSCWLSISFGETAEMHLWSTIIGAISG